MNKFLVMVFGFSAIASMVAAYNQATSEDKVPMGNEDENLYPEFCGFCESPGLLSGEETYGTYVPNTVLPDRSGL